MGHIFQLGTKYAEALDLKVLDEHGKLRTVIMGSYGVGVSRAVACVAEGNHDELGLVWPRALAPADVHLVATGKDDTVFTYAEELTRALEARGVEVLLDDRRQASPGVKFKDAELLGVPTIVVVGKGLAQGTIEVKDRATGVREEIPVDEVVDLLRISRDTVYRLVAAGKLPARKVGRQWRFSRAELEKHVGEGVE